MDIYNKYYIKNEKGEWAMCAKDEIWKEDVYGIGNMRDGHIFLKHTRCDTPGCNICELNYCALCGAYEGALTTECCGKPLSMEDLDDIYAGKMDYRYGMWLGGVKNEGMIWDREMAHRNNERILFILKDKIKLQTDLGRRVMEDIENNNLAWINAEFKSLRGETVNPTKAATNIPAIIDLTTQLVSLNRDKEDFVSENMHQVLARGERSLGGIVDLYYHKTLKGAVVEEYTAIQGGRDAVITMELRRSDGTLVKFRLVQEEN